MGQQDILREGFIWLSLVLLCLYAARYRAWISVPICVFALTMHTCQLAELEFIPTVPPHLIQVGSGLMAVDGFLRGLKLLSFTGTYSLLNKFSYVDWIPAHLHSPYRYELFKVALSLFIWVTFHLISRRYIRVRRKVKKTWDSLFSGTAPVQTSPVQWMPFIKSPVASAPTYSRHVDDNEQFQINIIDN